VQEEKKRGRYEAAVACSEEGSLVDPSLAYVTFSDAMHEKIDPLSQVPFGFWRDVVGAIVAVGILGDKVTPGSNPSSRHQQGVLPPENLTGGGVCTWYTRCHCAL
jgi:hypothetical protein